MVNSGVSTYTREKPVTMYTFYRYNISRSRRRRRTRVIYYYIISSPMCVLVYIGAGNDVGISNICSTSPRHSLQVSLANTTAHPAASPPELALSPKITHTHTLILSHSLSLTPPMIDLRRMRYINRRTLVLFRILSSLRRFGPSRLTRILYILALVHLV